MGRPGYSATRGALIIARSYHYIKIIGRDPEDWIPKGLKRARRNMGRGWVTILLRLMAPGGPADI